MYQLRADHNAVVNRRGLLRRWRFDAGARINGGLAVAGNTLFLNTFGKQLIALDIRTGQPKWRASADNILMSTPIVSRGLVFVGSGDNSRLSGAAGSSTYAPPRGGLGSPIWGRPEGDAILAFDVLNGTKRWQFQTVGEDMASPVYVENKLFFANGDLHAYSIDATTGRQLWMHGLEGLATMSSAAYAAGLVFISICNDQPYQCETLAIRPNTHAIVWKSPFGNSDSSPTYGQGRVFVSGIVESDRRALHRGRAVIAALDAITGTARWTFRTDSAGPYTEVGSSERAIAGTYSQGTYYQAIPTHDLLIAFDGGSGKVEWRFHSIAPIKMSPIILGNRLFVGDTAGILYAINSKSGKLLASAVFKQPFTTSPPILVGRNLIIANDSIVYSIQI